MKQVLTAKLKLVTTPEQFAALRATQLAYRDALNSVSRHAFAHGKMSNQVRLQRDTYAQIRATHHLPARMACNIPRQVGATYKGLWTKVKKNAAMHKAGLLLEARRPGEHPDALRPHHRALPRLSEACGSLAAWSHYWRG